ncbi:erythrocyte membrane-associated antigen, putative [Plasmodium vinckei petteri]|uniref:Erythrocyte membrane-associated antigen, putative n=1 Tax=Plasmodium vinckei petteri TaxID=138298 RepID=A0A6V7SPF2_PLAVN|nr:erythrocyte membrane-associated antigen, putative [Plasmodium vinckei petteri]
MEDLFHKKIDNHISLIKDNNMNTQKCKKKIYNISSDTIFNDTNQHKDEEDYTQKKEVESLTINNDNEQKQTKSLHPCRNSKHVYNIRNASTFSKYSKRYDSDSKIYTCKKSSGVDKKKIKKKKKQISNKINNTQNESLLDKTITTNSILSEYENNQNYLIKKNNENFNYDSNDTHDYSQSSKNKLDTIMYKKKMKQVNKILYNLNYFTQFKSLNLKNSMKKKSHTKIYIKKNPTKGQDIHNDNNDSSHFVTLNEFSKFKTPNKILENNNKNKKSILEQVKNDNFINDNFTDIKNNTESTNISKNSHTHNENIIHKNNKYNLNGDQNNKQTHYNNNTCEDFTFLEKWNDNYYKSEIVNFTNIPKKKIHNDKYFKSLLHIGLKGLLNKKRHKKKNEIKKKGGDTNYEHVQNNTDNETGSRQNAEEINLTVQKNISNMHNDIINKHKKHGTNNDNSENATCQNKIINCSEKNNNVNSITTKCFLSDHSTSPSNNFIFPQHKNYKYRMNNSIKNALDTNQKKNSTNINENSFTSLQCPISNSSHTQNIKKKFPQPEKLYNSDDQHNGISSNYTENENFLANNKEDLFFSEQKENTSLNLTHPINVSNIQQNDEANNNIMRRKKRRRRKKQKQRREKINKIEEILEQEKGNYNHEMNKIASSTINLPEHGKVKKKHMQLTNFEKVNNEKFSKKNKQLHKNEHIIMGKDELINLKTNKIDTCNNSNNEDTIIESFQIQKNETNKCGDKNNRSNSNSNSQKKKKKNIQNNKKKNSQNNTTSITSAKIQRNKDHEGYPQYINKCENNFIIPNANFSPDYLYNNYLNNIFCVQNSNRKYLTEQNEVAIEKQKINMPYFNHSLGPNYYINNIIPIPFSNVPPTHALRNHQNYDSVFNNTINANNLYYLDRWGNQIFLNSPNGLLHNYSKHFYNNKNKILKKQIPSSIDFANYCLYDRQYFDKYYMSPFNSRENYKIKGNFYNDFNPIINNALRNPNNINNADPNSNLNEYFINLYKHNYGHQNVATKNEKKNKLSKKYKKKEFQELPLHSPNFINNKIKNKSGNKNQCSYNVDTNNEKYDEVSNTNQSKFSFIPNYNMPSFSKQYNDMHITHKESNNSFYNFDNIKNNNNKILTQFAFPFPYTNHLLYPINFIYNNNNNISNNSYSYHTYPQFVTLQHYMNFFQNANINLQYPLYYKYTKQNEGPDLEKNNVEPEAETKNEYPYETIKKDYPKINKKNNNKIELANNVYYEKEKNKHLDNHTQQNIFNDIESKSDISNLFNKIEFYSNNIFNKNIKNMHSNCIGKFRSISLMCEKKNNKIKNASRSISIIPLIKHNNSTTNQIMLANCIISKEDKINENIPPFDIPLINYDKLFIFNLLRKTENNLVNILNLVKPTKDVILTKKLFFLSLLKLIKKLFHSNIHIYIVGSSAYGIDSKSSDLDIVIQTNEFPSKFILHTLYYSINKIKQEKNGISASESNCPYNIDNTRFEENEYTFFKDVEMQLIDSARVPILTLKKNNVACDLSVNTTNSIKHTEFFLSIMKCYPNLKNVMKLLKLLLKNRTIPSMKQGGLPTILWMMLSIRYCKFPKNKILNHTNKHQFYYPDQTNSENNYDIKELNKEENAQTHTQVSKQKMHTNSNTDTNATPFIRNSSLFNPKNEKTSYNTLNEQFLDLSYNYIHKFFSKSWFNEQTPKSCLKHYCQVHPQNGEHGEHAENANFFTICSQNSDCSLINALKTKKKTKTHNSVELKKDGKARNDKINSLKILHKNNKKIAKYYNIIYSKKNQSSLKTNNYLYNFQHDIEEEINEEYLLYASPLLYSLFIFYNALNSRKKLMKIINIIDKDRCYKKNVYETNKKLLSSACHGGVWDELLTLYDPIYSFNYDIFFNKSSQLYPYLMHPNPNGATYRPRARSTSNYHTGNINGRINESEVELKNYHRLSVSSSKGFMYQTKEGENNDQIRTPFQINPSKLLSQTQRQYSGRSSSQHLRRPRDYHPELYHNLNEQIKNDAKQNITFQSNLNSENIRKVPFENNKSIKNLNNLCSYNSMDKNNGSEISTIKDDLENNSSDKTNVNNHDTYSIENYNNECDIKCENSSYIQKQYNENLCAPLNGCSEQAENNHQNKPEHARKIPEIINNVHKNSWKNECNLDELTWAQHYNNIYNQSSQIWNNYKNNPFEKLHEHNIDLTSKASSATWLVYLYELKRASFFINYYIHHMHMLMSFKKLLTKFEQNCNQNIEKKYDQNFELFQNNKWVVLKREDIWKEDGQTAKLLSQKKNYDFENHTVLNSEHGHVKLKENPKYSEQDRKNISKEIICSQNFDENISKQKHLKKQKKQKKIVELIKNMKQILKSIVQNLNYSIISLFEKTKGDIYTLPYRLNSEENTKDNENKKCMKLNIYPNISPAENEPALDSDLSNCPIKNYKKLYDKNNDDTMINAFGLVLIEGKLIFVKFLNVCIDKQNFWNEMFLCRRDIKTVMHVKPMDVIFVSKKKKKYINTSKASSSKTTEINSKHGISKEMNQNNDHPISFSKKNNKSDRVVENNLDSNLPSTNLIETDKQITNENIYHQIISEETTSETISSESNAKKNKKNQNITSSLNHDRICYENNLIGEDKSIASQYETHNSNNTQNPTDTYSKYTLKRYDQSKENENDEEEEEDDDETAGSADTEQVIKDKIKNWDFKKQKRIHKSSNFIYNAKNNYIGILINQNKYRNDLFGKYTNSETESDKENIKIQKKKQTQENGDSCICPNICQDSTKDNVLLVNPCNFVTRINVKTVYVSSRHIINHDLKNAIFEKTNFKENDINENLKKKRKKINSSNIQHNEQPNDDIYSIQIIPRHEIMRYKELIKIMKSCPYYYKIAKNISNITKTPLQQPVSVCNFCSTKGTFNINTNHFMLSNIYEDARTELVTIICDIIMKQKKKRPNKKNLSISNNKKTETLNP